MHERKEKKDVRGAYLVFGFGSIRAPYPDETYKTQNKTQVSTLHISFSRSHMHQTHLPPLLPQIIRAGTQSYSRYIILYYIILYYIILYYIILYIILYYIILYYIILYYIILYYIILYYIILYYIILYYIILYYIILYYIILY